MTGSFFTNLCAKSTHVEPSKYFPGNRALASICSIGHTPWPERKRTSTTPSLKLKSFCPSVDLFVTDLLTHLTDLWFMTRKSPFSLFLANFEAIHEKMGNIRNLKIFRITCSHRCLALCVYLVLYLCSIIESDLEACVFWNQNKQQLPQAKYFQRSFPRAKLFIQLFYGTHPNVQVQPGK